MKRLANTIIRLTNVVSSGGRSVNTFPVFIGNRRKVFTDRLFWHSQRHAHVLHRGRASKYPITVWNSGDIERVPCCAVEIRQNRYLLRAHCQSQVRYTEVIRWPFSHHSGLIDEAMCAH